MNLPAANRTTSIFRRKPIDQIDEPATGTRLKRELGLWQLTAIGVGGIIGAGIFSLAGEVANKSAGPAVLLSFLIAGIASAAAAFSYAEFAGLIPRAGSAYTYGYAVLGEIVGWAIGWDLLLEYTAIVAVVAIGISGYFNDLLSFLHVSLPDWMVGAPGTEPDGGPTCTWPPSQWRPAVDVAGLMRRRHQFAQRRRGDANGTCRHRC